MLAGSPPSVNVYPAGQVLVECKNCGAPLDVGNADRFVTCRYCDKTTRVKSLRTLSIQTPSGFQPPPSWTPPPAASAPPKVLVYHAGAQHKAVAAANRAVSTIGCVVFFAGLAPALIGGVVAISEVQSCQPSMSAEERPQLGVVSISPSQTAVQTMQGLASGQIAVDSTLGANCRGYVTSAPHVSLSVGEATFVSLATTSTEDLVMVLRTAEGHHFCDDDSGNERQPRIGANLTTGTHRVWVGTYSQNAAASFTLSIGVASPAGGGPSMPDVATTLSPDAPAQLGEVSLAQMPNGATLTGQTIGMVGASAAQAGCSGYLPAGPSATLVVEEQRALQLDATAPTDLVMVVRTGPTTWVCDDDGGDGTNSRIGWTFAAGRYPVWVGTYSQHDATNFTLLITAP